MSRFIVKKLLVISCLMFCWAYAKDFLPSDNIEDLSTDQMWALAKIKEMFESGFKGYSLIADLGANVGCCNASSLKAKDLQHIRQLVVQVKATLDEALAKLDASTGSTAVASDSATSVAKVETPVAPVTLTATSSSVATSAPASSPTPLPPSAAPSVTTPAPTVLPAPNSSVGGEASNTTAQASSTETSPTATTPSPASSVATPAPAASATPSAGGEPTPAVQSSASTPPASSPAVAVPAAPAVPAPASDSTSAALALTPAPPDSASASPRAVMMLRRRSAA